MEGQDDTRERVAHNLRRLREKAELSQSQLGGALGMEGRSAISTISRWERGERAPSLHQARALAKALSCTVDDLLRPVRRRRAS